MGKDEETCANISLLSWGTSLGMGRSFLVGDEDKWEALNYTGRGCYTVCLLGIGFKSFFSQIREQGKKKSIKFITITHERTGAL